ncbi:MAG: glutamate racemase [Alphaproteobacteria bacterium]
MIVMDSGLGGLSVVRALKEARPGIAVSYLADTGGFPYGGRDAEWIRQRADTVLEALTAQEAPALVVAACNTLSTHALAHLRGRWPYGFVGTVPAIKVAAEQSKTRRFTLLATPGTSGSDYTNGLIAEFAAHCTVDCYGAPNLAALAEAMLLGETVAPGALRQELLPAFQSDARGRTDMVILGCTHYPLILEALSEAAPWPVGWIDSSPAIARHALSQMKANAARNIAYVTRAQDVARYAPIFAREGFSDTVALAV